jgi:hypothetical protein
MLVLRVAVHPASASRRRFRWSRPASWVMIEAGQRPLEALAMSPAAIGLVIIFLVIGCLLGWYSQKTTAAHSDVKVAKTRLAGGRKTRWRSGILVFAVFVIVALAVKDVLHPG